MWAVLREKVVRESVALNVESYVGAESVLRNGKLVLHLVVEGT